MELFKGPSDEEVIENINRILKIEPDKAFEIYDIINYADIPENKKEKYLENVEKEIFKLAEEGEFTPEGLFLASSSREFFEGIKKAFEINKDPRIPSKDKINQRTFTLPIHNSLQQRRYDITKYLIKNGQKYIGENSAGKLLLDVVRTERDDIVEILLDNYDIPQEYLYQAKNIIMLSDKPDAEVGEQYNSKIYKLLINKINNSN